MSIASAGPQWVTHTLRVLALLVVVTEAHATGAGSHKAGDIVTEAGSTKTADGKTVHYELGTLFVPENRAAANSRLIGVGFARIKGARPTGAPPIFILPGGPARSYLNAFTDEDAAAKKQLAGVVPYTAAGDVVVVDQRGYSKRGEELLVARPSQPLDRPRTLAADAAEMVKLAGDAMAAHPGKDLAGYTIIQCAEDVNDPTRARTRWA